MARVACALCVNLLKGTGASGPRSFKNTHTPLVGVSYNTHTYYSWKPVIWYDYHSRAPIVLLYPQIIKTHHGRVRLVC